MSDKIRPTAKGLPTLIALIRFFSSVQSLVLNEASTLTEGFPAFDTLVRLLSGVNPPVLGEARTLSE